MGGTKTTETEWYVQNDGNRRRAQSAISNKIEFGPKPEQRNANILYLCSQANRKLLYSRESKAKHRQVIDKFK